MTALNLNFYRRNMINKWNCQSKERQNVMNNIADT